jgi:hypothetical protein
MYRKPPSLSDLPVCIPVMRCQHCGALVVFDDLCKNDVEVSICNMMVARRFQETEARRLAAAEDRGLSDGGQDQG